MPTPLAAAQVKAAESVLRAYIPDPTVCVAAVFLEALDAYLGAGPGRKKAERKEGEPDGFSTFYEAYPRRVGRRAAAQAYGRALARAAPETILSGAKRYAETCRGTEERFIKHPSTWLNGDHWKDEMGNLAIVGGTDAFEEATHGGWMGRLDAFFGLSERPIWTWRKAWGPDPFQPDTKVPESVKRQFSAEHRDMDFKRLRAEYDGQQRKEM